VYDDDDDDDGAWAQLGSQQCSCSWIGDGDLMVIGGELQEADQGLPQGGSEERQGGRGCQREADG
jgi:hypothetical protein